MSYMLQLNPFAFDDLLNLSNKYYGYVCILSFIYRFYSNCKQKKRMTGPLKSFKMKRAEIKLINLHHAEENNI